MSKISKELCEVCGIEPEKVEKRCKECDLIMDNCGYLDCSTEDRAKEIERELEGLIYGVQG